ncbi:MAG: hypothetical protein R3A48_27690 [Polyangiales bacterium]
MNPHELWIVEHARWIFYAATLASAALGAALGPWLSSRVRGAAARRGLRALGEPLTHASDPRPRDATLEGTLEGSPGAERLALSAPRRADEAPARWRAPALTLVTAIGRVELVGEVDVRGGRSVSNDPGLPGENSLIALSSGEVVRASGVLEGVAAGAAQGEGYRDASASWRLLPGGAGAILAAAAPAPRRASRGASALAAGALGAGLLAALGVASLARADALRGREETQGARLVCAGEGTEWGALASVSPLTRRRAADGLLRTLTCRELRRIGDLEAADRVLRASGGDAATVCLRRAELFARASRVERAAALYETCETPDAAREAMRLWAYVSRFDRASALARRVETNDPVRLARQVARWHMLAGDRPAARAALVRAQEILDHRRPTRRERRRAVSLSPRSLACAIAWLDGAPSGCPDLRAPSASSRPCVDDSRMRDLDDGAGQGSTDRMLQAVGREGLREAYRQRDVRGVLRELRWLRPIRARDALVALVRLGPRDEEGRARVRAWVETEFPHDLDGRYDAGTLRWIAGAIDHPATLAEARSVMERQCAAERASAGEPALRALDAW